MRISSPSSAAVLILALTIVGCSDTTTSPVDPEFVPPAGVLMFRAAPDSENTPQRWDHIHLERMRTDGTERSVLTSFVGDIWNRLDLSPDGETLLFAASSTGSSPSSELMQLNVASGAVTAVANGAGAFSPSWSADGQDFAFLSSASGHGQVARMRLDGSQRQDLTSDLTYRYGVDWSPTANAFVYEASEQGGGAASELWTISSAGGTPTLLVGLVDPTGYPWTRSSEARWSPSGETVAFWGSLGGSSGLYLVEANGSNLRQILTGTARWPAWSPDGQWIVFSRSGVYYEPFYASWDLWMVRRDGSELHQLTFTRDVQEMSPIWARSRREFVSALNSHVHYHVLVAG